MVQAMRAWCRAPAAGQPPPPPDPCALLCAAHDQALVPPHIRRFLASSQELGPGQGPGQGPGRRGPLSGLTEAERSDQVLCEIVSDQELGALAQLARGPGATQASRAEETGTEAAGLGAVTFAVCVPDDAVGGGRSVEWAVAPCRRCDAGHARAAAAARTETGAAKKAPGKKAPAKKANAKSSRRAQQRK